MKKDIAKLLLVNVFLALADGAFYNFLELWLTSNNMSITTVSTVLSLAAFITVSVIFLSSNLIDQRKIKNFCVSLIGVKFLILIILFFLYQSNLNILIKFLIMFDYAIDVEISVSIYPLISMIAKNNKLYARRSLLYEIFYYIAALVATFVLGKRIMHLNFNYNTFTIISALFLFIAGLLLLTTNLKPYYSKKELNYNNDILFVLIRKIRNDKISLLYLAYVFFNNISFYAITGVLISILINVLNLEVMTASIVKLLSCILAAFLATLILEKLTFKNDYINLSIKFIGRIIVYLLPIIYLSNTSIIIAIGFTILLSSSYGHITDAPYINRFGNTEQLSFANLKEMVGYLSRAIGTFLCGYGLVHSIKYNFVISLVFTGIAIMFLFSALRNLNIERSALNDRK